MAKDWSDSEIDAIVLDYFVMLEHEQKGGAFSKAEHRRVLMETIKRSKRSIEFKHMNISAVMDALGLPYIKGYKPYRNYQKALFEAVKARLVERHDLVQLLTGKAGTIQQVTKTNNDAHIGIEFQYWADDRSLPLPSWGKFFMQLGAAVAEENNPQRSLVTALAVPTRSYAAVLVAAGAIMSMAKAIDRKSHALPRAHFKMLSSLPAGTSVILKKGGKKVKGTLVGVKDVMNDGTEMIGIQIQNKKGGLLTDWLPPKSSHKVQLSSKDWNQLPADVGKSVGVKTSKSEFIARIFEGPDLWNFITHSILDCVILGNVGTLEQEATTTRLSIGAQRRNAAVGTIQDILRLRRLSGTNEAFRSDIFPVNPRNNAMKSEEMTPHVVIFDGAAGFLKWRDKWSHCNWVIVLDRTEPRFAEAVQVVNAEYLNRISEEKLRLPDAPPVSVELISFTVGR